jgi:hypothetical protein
VPLCVQHYLAQKLGSDRNECEDALAFNVERMTFAVVDGATEAFGARYWSRLLAKSWIRKPSLQTSHFLTMVNGLAVRAHENWSQKVMPWYAEEKLRSGSYAAFIGLQFEIAENRMSWSAVAIGDCCLLQLRDGELLRSVPLSHSEQFSFRPVLLPTIQPATVAEHVSEFNGEVASQDVFLLLSDAIACWFLQAEKGDKATAAEFVRILASGENEALDILVDELRSKAVMRNDDIAAIHIKVQ